MPDPPNSTAENTEDCSSQDNVFAIFSILETDLQSLGPSSPAVFTDPEKIVISPPNSPVTYLPNPASTDGQYSFDSTSTIEASDNDLAVEVQPTVGVQLLVDKSNEDQHEPPTAYSFPTDGSPVLSHPNQLKHRAETTNLVNSRQHRREHFASRPTAKVRPRINSRHRYSLKPEFESWKFIFRDNQSKALTIQNTSLPSHLPSTCGSPTGCHCSPSLKTLAMLLFKTQSSHFFPSPEPPHQISSSF